MKNLLVLFVFVSGFALNSLQAQTTKACPPGCCKATCLPDGSCKTTDANGKTVICTPEQMKACVQTASACTPSPACMAAATTAEAGTPNPADKEKAVVSAKLVANRQEK